MKTYAVRGATTVKRNDIDSILKATKELLKELLTKNQLVNDDLVSMFFTTTADLNAVFPARAARELGITNVALMCAHEMNVPNALPKCIRVMVHVNKSDTFTPKYVYLREARSLRPDLFKNE